MSINVTNIFFWTKHKPVCINSWKRWYIPESATALLFLVPTFVLPRHTILEIVFEWPESLIKAYTF